MKPTNARHARRDSRGPSTKHRERDWPEELLRPTINARHAIHEGVVAMHLDEVDDNAILDFYASADRGREVFVSTSFTRNEAAFLGERMQLVMCEWGSYGWGFTDVLYDPMDALEAVRERRRVTQHVEPEVLAKRATREIMGASEVLVLDDPDEMLPEDAAWDYAAYLVDEFGY